MPNLAVYARKATLWESVGSAFYGKGVTLLWLCAKVNTRIAKDNKSFPIDIDNNT